MSVNLDGTRLLLDACRRLPRPPRFVLASSLAVFGGDLPEVVPETMELRPQSSYGTQKAICEMLVGDYSRKGYVDGRICRLPTVVVRPGKPNAAASSFASGIIREPIHVLESNCPVPLATRMWLSSPKRSEEHTSELQPLMRTSYAVFCLNKKLNIQINRAVL